jgi:hypothetical protein
VVENQREWWITATQRELGSGIHSWNVGKRLILKEVCFYRFDSTLARTLLFQYRLIE